MSKERIVEGEEKKGKGAQIYLSDEGQGTHMHHPRHLKTTVTHKQPPRRPAVV